MLIIGAAALLFFGPDQLPKVARRAGQVVREVQATSQSFIREMERAADESDLHAAQAAYARRPAEQPTAPELEWDAPMKPDPPEPPGDVIKPPDPPV
jgi:sec-independent protein translocase protein TatB